MNRASTPGRGALRRAALTVHALGDADRAWVLQALPPEQRAELEPMLVELGELGIPRDASLVNELRANVPGSADRPATSASPPQLAGSTLTRLGPDEVDLLVGVLQPEPPAIAVALLTAGAWPWREKLLDAWPEDSRAAVRAALDAAPLAPALQAAVIRAIEERLASRPPSPTAAPVSGAWHRIVARARISRRTP